MALRPPEGLCYALKFRTDTPSPPHPTDDVLLQQVVDFCLDGLREAGPASPRRREGLVEMTGPVNWLLSDGVTAAKFYTTKTPIPMLFVSLPVNGSGDWRLMAGFMGFVKEGELTINLINQGEIKLDARVEIDRVFDQRFAELHRLPSPAREHLMEALRGGGNLDEVIRNVADPNDDRVRSFF